MTYPLQVKAAQQKIIDDPGRGSQKLNAELAAATDPAAQEKLKADIAAAEKAKASGGGDDPRISAPRGRVSWDSRSR